MTHIIFDMDALLNKRLSRIILQRHRGESWNSVFATGVANEQSNVFLTRTLKHCWQCFGAIKCGSDHNSMLPKRVWQHFRSKVACNAIL